jgi:endopolyphosphatase
VIEYNVTGLENNPVWAESFESSQDETELESLEEKSLASWDQALGVAESFREGSDASVTKNKKKHKKPKKPKSPKNPNLNIPPPPSKSSPPGPAYSPQTLTLLGYTQYFANLTHINNDTDHPKLEDSTETSQRREGKHKDKRPKHDKPVPNKFNYEVEYSTFNDSLFGLEDMTVRSYLKLAHRIGQYKPTKGWNDKHIKDEDGDVSEHGGIFSELINDVSHAIDHYLDILSTWLAEETHNHEMSTEKGGKGHKKRRKNEVWLAFIKRAFVGTLSDEEMEDFLQAREMSARAAAEELEEL